MCLKMAESFLKLDNILRGWVKDMVQKVLSRHFKGTRCRKKKEKAISFLEKESENILDQSRSAKRLERD